MSQWIGFTNKKLYQSRLLLSEFAQCEQKALMSALEESALYQLHDAWLSYLQELGDMVAYRQPVQSLQELVGQVNLITGEMRELMQLQANAFSWLSQMLKAVEDLRYPDAARPVQQAGAQNGGVQTISLVQETTESQVAAWWQALSALIDTQRENRQES